MAGHTSTLRYDNPSSVYAQAPNTLELADCYFYHTMDVPGHGLVTGEWDLRGVEHQYLGGLGFSGRRVLELGPASGHLTCYMERQGAEVIAYDLSEDFSWDTVPFSGLDLETLDTARRQHIRRLNNGLWFNLAANNSAAKVVYGTAYTVPDAIGMVDTAVFSSVLLHLRDPFLALQTALRLTTRTAVVTDVYPAADLPRVAHLVDGPAPRGYETYPLAELGEPKMDFLPRPQDRAPADTWWHLTPAVVQRFLGVLGFAQTEVTYHFAPYGDRRTLLYTVVGNRQR